MADATDVVPVSEEELRNLPHWAIVAFAARCARRIQPRLIQRFPDAPRELVDDIEQAIAFAESSARAGRANATDAQSRDATAHAIAAREAAERASNTALLKDVFAVSKVDSPNIPGDAAFKAEVAIVRAAAYAAGASAGATTPNAVSHAFDAANATQISSVAAAARFDYEALLRLARDQNWTNDTPVDVMILGSLWPQVDPYAKLPVMPLEDIERDAILHTLKKFAGDRRKTASALGISVRTLGAKLKKWKAENSITNPPSLANALPIDFYFDTSEFSPDEIGAILGTVSAMYTSLTGDELIIDDCGIADISGVLIPTGGDA